MQEPVQNPEIAPHKSTMENPLLYREKNEVAGMGRKKKNSETQRSAVEEKRMQGQLSKNEVLSVHNANPKGDPLWESFSELFNLWKKEQILHSLLLC